MFPFKLALNASTLFPFKLDIRQQIEIAAQAGYEGIEIWIRDVETYLAQGGKLTELKQVLDEVGITVVNAIAFFAWADEDANVRAEALQQAEREMRMLAELGCGSIAAPPYGNVANVTLEQFAAYLVPLVALGRSVGVEPYLEFWGRASKLSTLGEAMYIAIQSRIPDVKLLLDPFHMYTGGSQVEGLAYLKGEHIGIVHINDYPESPMRETITDADRVFPGDGVAPLTKFALLLQQAGYNNFLSLELFLADVGEKSALEIAKEGHQKARQAFTLQSIQNIA